MIRLSSSMLASGLLNTNTESHKRELSSERLLADSGAAQRRGAMEERRRWSASWVLNARPVPPRGRRGRRRRCGGGMVEVADEYITCACD